MYFPQGNKRLVKFNAILGCCIGVWLCATSISGAQTEQTPAYPAHPRFAKSASLSSMTSPLTENIPGDVERRVKKSKLPTPANELSQPAMVSLRNGELTVEANNSDLTQILQNFSLLSGMKIQGMKTGPRIFGVYGPGDAREILSDLLAGSGYNFVMVGGANGSIPHDLLLTAQNDHAATHAEHNSHPAIPSESVEAEPLQTEAPQRYDVVHSSTETSGTGAFSAAPSRNDLDSDTRMQQTLQRLQHVQEPSQDATQ